MTQELMLADDLMPSLKAGAKLCTIRKGKRDIVLGRLFFRAVVSRETVPVIVTEVVHKMLGALTDEEARLDGAADATQMAEVLKRFYPDIHSASDITIVKHHLDGSPPHLSQGAANTFVFINDSNGVFST